MPGINEDLLRVLAALHGQGGDASVTVRAGEGRRVLHFSRGYLVSGGSNFKSERLGDVLATLGKLDPVLIEPVAAEAKRKGRLLGDQLLADRLLKPDELVGALEQQCLFRFQHAFMMEGAVDVGPKAAIQPALHRQLGALVVATFREKLPFDAVERFLANRSGNATHGKLGADLLDRLELLPAELRICRRLAAGEPLHRVRTDAAASEQVARMAGALKALELWTPGASDADQTASGTTYTWS